MPTPRIHLVPDAEVAGRFVADLVCRLVTDDDRSTGSLPLLGCATGRTFAPFLAEFERDLNRGRLRAGTFFVTHLDEYLRFTPDQRGGMVDEMMSACPTLAGMLIRGHFWPVPSEGNEGPLRDHEARIAAAGGVGLQLLGLGRNGHIAFNEPGTDFDLGFHRTKLAPETRQDATARFAPLPVPTEAVTAGPRSILAARTLLLMAFGTAKAQAVQAMLEGPVDPSCPASILQRHPRMTILLDQKAAALLAPVSRDLLRPLPEVH